MNHKRNRQPDSNLLASISLDGQWAFLYRPESLTGKTEADIALPAAEDFDATMLVPGRWDDHTDRIAHTASWSKARFNPAYRPIRFPIGSNPPDASLPYLLGTGWYRHTFQAVDDLRYTLHVGGVCMEAWVWLNGNLVHHHECHSVPLIVDLDPAQIGGGDNELIIAVDNTREDRLGCDIRGFKGKSGGITDSAQLLVWHVARVTDCFIHADSNLAELSWQVALLRADEDVPLHVCCRLRDQHGQVVRETQVITSESNIAMTMDAVGLPQWSDRDPHLMSAEVDVFDGEKCVHQHRQPFGLRRLTRNGMGLQLNSVPTYMCGITEHAYYPQTCTPPTDVRFYRQIIRRFKEHGFNWLRFHTWVPPVGYLQAADELGMLVQVEPPLNFSEDEWLAILRHCRTHPSVVIYCGGNEERLDEAKIAQLEQCAAQQKTYAPDALFNPQEALRGVEYHFPDDEQGLVHEPFTHHPQRLEKLKTFCDLFGSYSWGKFSYSSAEADLSDVDQRLAIYDRPCLSHEITIHGSYLNLDLEKRYEHTRIGSSIFRSARELLEQSGRLHRAATYYQNSAALHAELRKHALESVRLCSKLSGYNMLGAIDAHWHRSGYACGLLNEFYESKGSESPEQVKRYNNASVLLCELPNRRNLTSGESVDWPLFASRYGCCETQSGDYRWRVVDHAGRTVAAGDGTAAAEPGGLSRLGHVRFDAPAVDTLKRYDLHVQFDSDELSLENGWPLWCMPDVQCSSIDEECRVLTESKVDDLVDGASVLLLGCEPFENIDIRYQQALAGRPNGHLGTVVQEHPLTNMMPHHGWCDRFFFDMINGSKAVIMDNLLDQFDPIIEVMGAYKQASAYASLFECQVGKGRLLVCSMNLREEDAGARWLRSMMQRYVQSEAFQPTARLEPAVLRQLLQAGSQTRGSLATDEAFDDRAQLKK